MNATCSPKATNQSDWRKEKLMLLFCSLCVATNEVKSNEMEIMERNTNNNTIHSNEEKKNYVISTIPTLIKPYVDTILLQLNWWNQSLLFHTLCVSFLLLLFRLVLSLSISFSFCLFRHRFHRIQLNTPYVFRAIHGMYIECKWKQGDHRPTSRHLIVWCSFLDHLIRIHTVSIASFA